MPNITNELQLSELGIRRGKRQGVLECKVSVDGIKIGTVQVASGSYEDLQDLMEGKISMQMLKERWGFSDLPVRKFTGRHDLFNI